LILPFKYERQIFLEFGVEHFVNDTGRTEQCDKNQVSIIGQIRKVSGDEIIIHTLIMGAPSLDHSLNKDVGIEMGVLMWYGYNWFETFPEDIDEFAKCKDVEISEPDEWIKFMKELPEEEVKNRFAEILGDTTRADWGGEMADHITSVRLGGQRKTAAFLLKGPSRFREMTPELLGKRADQIYRLSQTPANLLVVQHCFTIGEAVRATLRAFSVAPHNPRRYCLIDGEDTYKILKAYGKIY